MNKYMKPCIVCKKRKPTSEFEKSTSNRALVTGLKANCKECQEIIDEKNINQKKLTLIRKEEREKEREFKKKMIPINRLKNRYNKLIQDYINMFEEKQGIEFTYWHNDEVGSVAIFGEYWIDFKGIKHDIEKNQEKGKILNK